MVSSGVMACINPHRLSPARTLKSALAVKVQGAPVRDEDVLMKSLIPRHEATHELRADAAPLIIWKHEQMRIVNDQKSIRNRVTKSNKLAPFPSRNQRMRSQQRLVQQFGSLCRRPV